MGWDMGRGADCEQCLEKNGGHAEATECFNCLQSQFTFYYQIQTSYNNNNYSFISPSYPLKIPKKIDLQRSKQISDDNILAGLVTLSINFILEIVGL